MLQLLIHNLFLTPFLVVIIHCSALEEIGEVQHAVVVHGCGLDEVSPLGSSKIIELRRVDESSNGRKYLVSRYSFDPLSVGINRCKIEDLKGGATVKENADMLREVLQAGEHGNARRDAVLLNAGFGNYVFGLSESVLDGVRLAREKLQQGAGAEKLEEWIGVSAPFRSVEKAT